MSASAVLFQRFPMRPFIIQEYETVDVGLLRANRDHVYVIEVTLDHKACDGDEAILREPNTCGIPVCNSSARETHAPFSDQENERGALLEALRKLYRIGRDRTLKMPQAGIGSGSYGLASHSPSIHVELCRILAEHFGYCHPSTKATLSPHMASSSGQSHQRLFAEVCTGGGLYMASHIAEQHDLTLQQLKAYCLRAGDELNALGKLYPLHRPIYRWAKGG
jgi:hypothetical protein